VQCFIYLISLIAIKMAPKKLEKEAKEGREVKKVFSSGKVEN
jgi:hypothetical protein